MTRSTPFLDVVTFSHIEESAPGSSSSSPNSNGKEGGPEDDETVDDEEFEQSLAVFGLKRKKERKSQRDKRKRAKGAKAPRKEQEEGDTLFRESMKKLQEQGDKISGVLESMERNQAQQLQLMNQFMNNFMQATQSSKDK